MARRGIIEIYCRCEGCGVYFVVNGKKASRYCGRSCRDKVYYVAGKKKKALEELS